MATSKGKVSKRRPSRLYRWRSAVTGRFISMLEGLKQKAKSVRERIA